MKRAVPYAAITRAAGEHADAVMNAMPRCSMRAKRARREQLDRWAVAFEAFKRGARWRRRKEGGG